MFRSVRRASAALVFAIAALVFIPAAVAETVVTLSGESLNAGPNTTVTFHCGTSATDLSSITYEATGAATGPYPGTFWERGSTTFGNGAVESFSAEFTITPDAGGSISGTKQLNPAVAPLAAACTQVEDITDFTRVEVPETYEATVTDALGRTWTESGRASTQMTAFTDPLGGATRFSMSQFFTSGGPPGLTVTLSPATSVNPVDTQHSVTATVRDALMQPVEGITVFFQVISPQAQGAQCTTDAAGTCTFLYQGPPFPQADDITACADTNVNGQVDPGEPCGDASKVWTAPATTPGQVMGGGYIRDSSVSFAVHANAATITDPVNGGCNVNDHASHIRIRCLGVTTLVIAGTHATLYGDAEQDGVATNYAIDVGDLSGIGAPDTFQIQTGLGYINGGPLTGGNVQVRP